MRYLYTSFACAAARYRNNTAPGNPADYFKVWLFNITNLEDVRKGGKPVLVGDGAVRMTVYCRQGFRFS